MLSQGLYKTAFGEDSEGGSHPVTSAINMLAPAAIAAGSAYAMARRKKPFGPKSLQKIQQKSEGLTALVAKGDVHNPSVIGRALDPIQYTSAARKAPKGHAVLDLVGAGESHKGAINYIGRKKVTELQKNLSRDKYLEQNTLKKHIGRDTTIPTHLVSDVAKGKTHEDKLKALDRKFPKGWFLKDRSGFQGMERGRYVASGDISEHVKKHGKLPDALREAFNPQRGHKFVVQPFTSIRDEYRVHVLGNTVIPGATVNRAYPKSDWFHTDEHGRVEQAVQKALKKSKLPDAMYGFDVAVGPRGSVKIIETNPVDRDSASGFLYHEAPLRVHGALYKATTGRAPRYQAGIHAAVAGAGGAAIGHELDKRNK